MKKMKTTKKVISVPRLKLVEAALSFKWILLMKKPK